MKKNKSSFIILAVAVLFLLMGSCNEAAKEKTGQPETGKKVKPAIIKKPGSSFNDTLVIDSKSAVFYVSDTLQMEKIKEVNEKKIFEMLTHNCHYQMQNARQVIREDWPQIKIIETYKHRYLLFKKANKAAKCIDLNNKNGICGLFLFDRKKDPVLADMPNIETQMNLYFSR
jgi:hypothetical protein